MKLATSGPPRESSTSCLHGILTAPSSGGKRAGKKGGKSRGIGGQSATAGMLHALDGAVRERNRHGVIGVELFWARVLYMSFSFPWLILKVPGVVKVLGGLADFINEFSKM